MYHRVFFQEPTRHLSVRLPLHLWRRLSEVAAEQRETPSEVVRAALRQLLPDETETTSGTEAGEAPVPL